MTMTTKWAVRIGDRLERISSDLLSALGYGAPYVGEDIARFDLHSTGMSFCPALAEALASGLCGDAAAMAAISLHEQRRAAQSIETARQKVAEIEAKAAADRLAAEALALTREREAREQR